ncbi:MAG: DUF1887 family protein [Clostridia bacterium]|nr:DUF1887 family protein [Clostridia bacterium]
MKTLIELFDKDAIYNYLAATVFKPQKVCFIGDKLSLDSDEAAAAKKFASLAGLDCKFEFISANTNDYNDMRRTIEETIRKETANGNDCSVDVTGGKDLALVAAGSLIPSNVNVIRYDKTVNAFRFLGSEKTQKVDIGLTCEAFITIAGGTIFSKPRNMNYGDKEWEIIRKVTRIYFENREIWNRFVKYLQQVAKGENEKVRDNLFVDAPFSFSDNDRVFSCNKTVMREHERAQAIKNLHFSDDGNRLSFEFFSAEIANLLVNEGVWLELAVYLAGKNSDKFSDVQTSVKFVWDIASGDETLGSIIADSTPRNEIDVVLTRGVMPVFVSCKTRAPINDDLNELYTIKQKFGGELAKAVLATTKFVGDDWPVAERAKEMGIFILDERYFENKTVTKQLEKITELN